MGLANHAFFYREAHLAEHVIVRTCRDDDGDDPDDLIIQNLLEVLVTGSLKHKNVVKVVGIVSQSLPIHIIFEFGDLKHGFKGTLESVLHKGRPV